VARKKAAAKEPRPANTLQDKLSRIGIAREQDLVLHLPLRYEDQTHLCPLAALKPGQAWQVEGVVANTEIQYRGRRQLVCLLDDGADRGEHRGDQLVLRFFHFYPNQQKALAAGKRVRAFGEVRDGQFGLEMVHPSFQVVAPGTPLPDRLTPVYPTTAGLSQDALEEARASRAARRSRHFWARRFPRGRASRAGSGASRRPVHFLHEPPPEAANATAQASLDQRTHPAWTRLKFDELLAQQLSLKMHRRARARRKAPRLPGDGSLTRELLARLPFKLTQAQQRVIAEIRRDLARGEPMQRLLQGDVGSGKTVVAALAALAGDRIRLSGRVHGADRNPGRAALPQARGLARRLAAANRLVVRRAACERPQRRRLRPSSAARRSSRSVRMRCSRTRSCSRSWDWPSSTSSIVSGSRKDSRFGRKASATRTS
jgi:ATP-dependent DNA helicase RecG